jgi:hypothetical protein
MGLQVVYVRSYKRWDLHPVCTEIFFLVAARRYGRGAARP